MNNKIKFEHIKKLWYLKDGVIYTRYGNKPVSFSSKNSKGRRFQQIEVNGKCYCVFIYEAIFILHHNRPIAEGKEIHHVDGDYENNAPENLIELTRTQHMRIHQYQCEDPMRGIDLYKGAWRFLWRDDNGKGRGRSFHGINDAMTFRATIEEPRRQELRALGLNCKRAGNVSSGEKSRAIIASKFYFSRSNTNL
ncbi:HNH endonuclease signature motif containing protein [Escherichia coli]|uniref:HNH endonuclease signature motif containing protein n=1 Tax=Escherichia coli TaxID=562 RepID=UPI0002CB513F|nr:HNH endonuclease signature motif containing protein [Escherichia coli]EFH3246773.1 HNH endonuclease [Escherichia coli]EJV7846399.1 HNH endonuclease [Escherichia coli]EKS8398848.1 HNH endonuclease [Escherichia coli]EMU77625.1 HNH endonuclease family protein [Escherichia coli MP021017.9]EMU80261.1 HNH endonuclease family protein [Escherichia coli MP021017.6]